ncbi:MAG: beta-lactamase domain protein [Daejeonella sp.]|nr:beta-lactamase domain protein [Daejeonella sp.]
MLIRSKQISMENQDSLTQKGLVIKTSYFNVAHSVWGKKLGIVNIYMIASSTEFGHWVLVDAGMKGYSSEILAMAEQLFGNHPPSAIILTHGHFDHVGTLKDLLKVWDVPVYAHQLEMPYLTGRSSYPSPDPTVGGGLLSLLSFAFPKKPIDLGDQVHELSHDGTVPFLPEWQVLFTPGHTYGHISLYREEDKVLIAGDAFVTTKQESLFYALTQLKHISGPPKYFTPDWISAAQSVRDLANLQPFTAATGHGKPMRGEELESALSYLASHFEEVAIPKHGKYVPVDLNSINHKKMVSPAVVKSLFGITLFALAAFTSFLVIDEIAEMRNK